MDKIPRPKQVPGRTFKVDTAQCGEITITVNLPWESFCRIGNPGGCQNVWAEAVARCISIGLRCGVPVEEYIEQLKDLKCPSPSVKGLPDDKLFISCPDSIARTLSKCIESVVDLSSVTEEKD